MGTDTRAQIFRSVHGYWNEGDDNLLKCSVEFGPVEIRRIVAASGKMPYKRIRNTMRRMFNCRPDYSVIQSRHSMLLSRLSASTIVVNGIIPGAERTAFGSITGEFQGMRSRRTRCRLVYPKLSGFMPARKPGYI
ncbi:hypothetical protein B0H10DRAFT_1953981 [Mycena sp. CBHHK59/15]|nr:hypothetical protein B0H10DRAFT_1953981 [Mycena sp. CBHHK59/15]